ncbi:MAG: DUF2752 domain-containing protein, partial [Polyangiales bacterium]
FHGAWRRRESMCYGLLGALWTTAWLLPANPRGYGSHEALGLPPCTLRLWLGMPCPGCGMTTAFAHLLKGHGQSAWSAQPAGVILAAFLMAFTALASVGMWRAWSPLEVLWRLGAHWIAFGLSGLIVLVWSYRLYG